MANRCSDCNKFVSQEDGDVDVQNEDASGSQITVEVRIVQVCEDCGTDLKEATLSIERNLEDEVEYEEHNFEADYVAENGKPIDDDGVETGRQLVATLFALLTDRSDEDIVEGIDEALRACKVEHTLEITDTSLDNESWSTGKGRSCKTFRGVSGTIAVQCSCGWEHTVEVTAQQDDAHIAASGMDELT